MFSALLPCMARATRFDFTGPIERPELLADGTLKIPAYLSRTGVLVYEYEDGTTVREWRPPEEVFSDDSLSTWRDLAVTDDHPPEPVTPSNWKTYATGHIAGHVRKDGDFVAGHVVVKDAGVIARIAAKELRELSSGYIMEIDPTPGITPEGEAYDAIQRNIVGNHVAIGPDGWGRAGPNVRLYAGDSARSVGRYSHSATTERKGEAMASQVASEKVNRSDAEKSDPMVPKADYDKLQGEMDALKGSYDKLSKAFDEMKSAGAKDAKKEPAPDDEEGEGMDSKFSVRLARAVDVRTKAVKVDSAIDVSASRSDRDIMIDAIKASDPKFDAKDKSDDYLAGRFDREVADAGRADARGSGFLSFVGAVRADAEPPADGPAEQIDRADARDDFETARINHHMRVRDAWRKPVGTTVESVK